MEPESALPCSQQPAIGPGLGDNERNEPIGLSRHIYFSGSVTSRNFESHDVLQFLHRLEQDWWAEPQKFSSSWVLKISV